METFAALRTQHGDTFALPDGTPVALTQQPYSTNASYNLGGGAQLNLGDHYAATATTEADLADDEEPRYTVVWRIANPDADDESDACDWSNHLVLGLHDDFVRASEW